MPVKNWLYGLVVIGITSALTACASVPRSIPYYSKHHAKQVEVTTPGLTIVAQDESFTLKPGAPISPPPKLLVDGCPVARAYTTSAGMERWLKRQGFDQPQDEISDEDAFAALASASIAGRVALGIRAGKRVRRLRRLGGREVKLPPRCAQVGGFNLHAGVVIGAHNREGLARLCRYVARPPLSSKRMHIQPNGQILIRLKRAWMDGTQHLEFSPIELLEKLAALVPPPRVNQILYHGVLAPRAKWRQEIVPKPSEREAFKPLRKCATHTPRRRHTLWAELLWHSFGVDGWACFK